MNIETARILTFEYIVEIYLGVGDGGNMDQNLNYYFRLHTCLSFHVCMGGSVTIEFFITLIGPEALSKW